MIGREVILSGLVSDKIIIIIIALIFSFKYTNIILCILLSNTGRGTKYIVTNTVIIGILNIIL